MRALVAAVAALAAVGVAGDAPGADQTARTFVVVDLSDVSFIDSSGIRLIVEAARSLELTVVRGGPEVTRVFGLVGLEGRVTILDAPPDL